MACGCGYGMTTDFDDAVGMLQELGRAPAEHGADMTRTPWFKFYPSDWRGDVKLACVFVGCARALDRSDLRSCTKQPLTGIC